MGPTTDEEIGQVIFQFRKSRDIRAQDLASKLGVDLSTITKIEQGKRRVRASEVAIIADFFGVSPMAILDRKSSVGRLALSARASDPNLGSSSAMARISALAEFHQLFLDAEIAAGPNLLDKAPVPNVEEWKAAAESLAQWVHEQLGDLASGDAKFDSLAYEIESVLGVDVLVEPHKKDSVLGLAVTDREFPLIFVNSAKPRRQALFTLAHELGHILVGDGALILDESLRNRDNCERLANAFAATFLMPETEIRSIADPCLDADRFGKLLQKFGVSVPSLVYRLHNLGIVRAAQRDALKELTYAKVAEDVSERSLARALSASDGSPSYSCRVPSDLANRAKAAYRSGAASVGPFAGLMNMTDDDAIDLVESDKDGPSFDAIAGHDPFAASDEEDEEEQYWLPAEEPF